MSWNRDELFSRAAAMRQRDPSIRRGQSIYNAAYSMNPAVAHLAGSDVDPFYNDDRIDAFLERLSAPSAASKGGEGAGS